MRAISVFVHPQALCESASVGSGTRVWAFAHVMDGAVVGADCNICDGAFVESGARLGNGVTVKNNVLVWDGVTVEDDVFLGPAMVFTNDRTPRAYVRKDRAEFLSTVVRRGASIGAQAVIVCGVEVGAYAMVAAGAVVIRDIPAHALVAGNPARPIGWVCWCGARLDSTLGCRCGRRYDGSEAGGLMEATGCARQRTAARPARPGRNAFDVCHTSFRRHRHSPHLASTTLRRRDRFR